MITATSLYVTCAFDRNGNTLQLSINGNKTLFTDLAPPQRIFFPIIFIRYANTGGNEIGEGLYVNRIRELRLQVKDG
jgi:hypothetical protein